MSDYFWSRLPGRFLDKTNGAELHGATFTGTIREWFETLIEVMIDVTIHAVRERGGAPIPGCEWRVDATIKTIIECSVLYKPILSLEPEMGTIGADHPGVICNVPVRAEPALYGSRMIELYRGDERIGSVRVLDVSERAV